MRSRGWIFAAALLLVGCSSNQAHFAGKEARVRQFPEWTIDSGHREITMRVEWRPYEEGTITRTGRDEWTIAQGDSGRTASRVPVIVVSYPDSGYVIPLDVGISDALLGTLIKHTLMTEVPIRRPYMEYLATADCAKCHPPHIKLEE